MIAVAISVPAGLLLKYPPGIEQRNSPHFNRATPMVKSTSEITNSKITKSPFKWFHIYAQESAHVLFPVTCCFEHAKQPCNNL